MKIRRETVAVQRKAQNEEGARNFLLLEKSHPQWEIKKISSEIADKKADQEAQIIAKTQGLSKKQ